LPDLLNTRANLARCVTFFFQKWPLANVGESGESLQNWLAYVGEFGESLQKCLRILASLASIKDFRKDHFSECENSPKIDIFWQVLEFAKFLREEPLLTMNP
jgi:hypothetical protein